MATVLENAIQRAMGDNAKLRGYGSGVNDNK